MLYGGLESVEELQGFLAGLPGLFPGGHQISDGGQGQSEAIGPGRGFKVGGGRRLEGRRIAGAGCSCAKLHVVRLGARLLAELLDDVGHPHLGRRHLGEMRRAPSEASLERAAGGLRAPSIGPAPFAGGPGHLARISCLTR